ncbi:MAG: hypothetical protein LBR37_00540 [Erysipelotrichaceae bacterium]|jgi:hypothetical protein|nr:hypothetical protein [Erysipelotrichaceae bacterium]
MLKYLKSVVEKMKLEIIRKSGYYFDSQRYYKIFINGTIVGEIWSGEVKSFDLPDGDYDIQFQIDWCTSQTIRIETDRKTSVITCWPATKWMNILWKATFGCKKYINAELTK